jgi:hypothetical protein
MSWLDFELPPARTWQCPEAEYEQLVFARVQSGQSAAITATLADATAGEVVRVGATLSDAAAGPAGVIPATAGGLQTSGGRAASTLLFWHASRGRARS